MLLKEFDSHDFIVDNSPSNELQEVVASYRSSRLIYIWGQGNIGYGAGHNIAINKSFESDANYHIILNPDVIFQPEVIAVSYTHLTLPTT